ncbi:MAG: right-handed parallel beta-helix repeat-containing protein [Phycisphaerales bacterium]|nr:MAG: right-handed parallel beta-helix repeat-containing protein [Phycisphaerales bacterium]
MRSANATILLATLALLPVVSCGAAPRTLYVDDDGPANFNNIQAAIDDSSDGDTIIVKPGTYTGDGNRDIDFLGKAVTVRSTEPNDLSVVAATVIDCNASEEDRHRGFIFDSNEGPDSVLDGLTIKNGYAPEVKVRSYRYSFGGGILCRGASPVISNCIIKDNKAGRRGGGILSFEDAEPQIINCTITGNTGGGIFNDRGKITKCTVTENGSFGIASMYGEVIDCVVTHNKGVGLDCSWFIQPTVRGCIISHNQDGGVQCFDSGGYLFNCIISGNRSSESGGGIKAVGEINSLVIENCVIVGNTSEGPGGAIVCGTELGDGPLIRGTIIAHNRNTAVAESGGYGGSRGDPHIQSCLFYDNAGGDFYDYDTDTTSTGAEQINAFERASANIDGDPCFASLGYWDPNGTPDDPNDDFWVDGDYQLRSQAGRWEPGSKSWVKDHVTSPCIDAGDPTAPIGLERFPNGGVVNIGAYGGTAEASKSYYGEPVCGTPVAGDINGDCRVDSSDLAILVSHWLEEHETDAAVACPRVSKDMRPAFVFVEGPVRGGALFVADFDGHLVQREQVTSSKSLQVTQLDDAVFLVTATEGSNEGKVYVFDFTRGIGKLLTRSTRIHCLRSEPARGKAMLVESVPETSQVRLYELDLVSLKMALSHTLAYEYFGGIVETQISPDFSRLAYPNMKDFTPIGTEEDVPLGQWTKYELKAVDLSTLNIDTLDEDVDVQISPISSIGWGTPPLEWVNNDEVVYQHMIPCEPNEDCKPYLEAQYVFKKVNVGTKQVMRLFEGRLPLTLGGGFLKCNPLNGELVYDNKWVLDIEGGALTPKDLPFSVVRDYSAGQTTVSFGEQVLYSGEQRCIDTCISADHKNFAYLLRTRPDTSEVAIYVKVKGIGEPLKVGEGSYWPTRPVGWIE